MMVCSLHSHLLKDCCSSGKARADECSFFIWSVVPDKIQWEESNFCRPGDHQYNQFAL